MFPSTVWRWTKRVAWGILLLILLFIVGSVLSNAFLASRSGVVDRLSALEKARIEEVFRLRRGPGETLWTGWGEAHIPVILYNEEYTFLCRCDNPAPGWVTVPRGIRHGGAWEMVPADSVDGRPYYRQRLPADGVTPQAFTVRVGGLWVASMTTKEWSVIKVGNEIRDGLPALLRPLVPYRLAGRIIAGSLIDTDWYICAIAHESFHAFQGMIDSARLAEGEIALSRDGGRYPWENQAFNASWKEEFAALDGALSAAVGRRAIELGRKFLALRQARRHTFHLDTNLTRLEWLREWEEGVAKYTELAIWKIAAGDSQYAPVQSLGDDPEFNRYAGFRRQWAREVSTLRFQSGAGETRFYYSGMAQAFLLDRVSPGWRAQILRDNVFLEDVLAVALSSKKVLQSGDKK